MHLQAGILRFVGVQDGSKSREDDVDLEVWNCQSRTKPVN
jgi:hypothetical protein